MTPTTLAEEFGRENFEAGYVGTPASGAGSVRFTATMVESDKISVTGNVNATATLARLFGINTDSRSRHRRCPEKRGRDHDDPRPVRFHGWDEDDRPEERGEEFPRLSSPDTQDKDKVGLISFATTARYVTASPTGHLANTISLHP